MPTLEDVDALPTGIHKKLGPDVAVVPVATDTASTVHTGTVYPSVRGAAVRYASFFPRVHVRLPRVSICIGFDWEMGIKLRRHVFRFLPVSNL